MLPIDEYAKSGDIVYVRFFGALAFQPCRYLKGVWRSEFDGRRIDVEPEGYLPPPYIENAAKMRETLSLMVSSFDAGMLPNKNILEDARKVLAAVKRSPNQEPEPSEAERVEKVAAVIERELMIDERLLADPATLRKIKSQRIARAALKAMEQGQ